MVTRIYVKGDQRVHIPKGEGGHLPHGSQYNSKLESPAEKERKVPEKKRGGEN